MNLNRRHLLAISATAPLALAAVPAVAAGAAPRMPWPNVPLTTHRGRRVRFYDDLVRGDRIVAFNFMYAQCGDVCPGASLNLARLQERLGARVGREIFFYSITLEPHKDSLEILAHYARQFDAGPGWSFLTGARADIERLRRASGFVDPDPRLDAKRSSHIGMLRYGNDALDRWAACPAVLAPDLLARSLLGIGHAAA